MELIEDKKDSFVNFLLENISHYKERSNISNSNLDSLQNMISYLTNLKNDFTIDEKQFSELLTIVCSNFIENEVDKRISNMLNKELRTYILKVF